MSSAVNGLDVLEKIGQQEFNIVLMDIQMPEMGGLEATTVIRNREIRSSRHLTIVALTAQAMASDRDICLAAGMDAYITKPINKEEPLNSIEKLLSRHNTRSCTYPVTST